MPAIYDWNCLIMCPIERSPEEPTEKQSLATQVVASTFDGAVQRPLNGLTELGGQLTGVKLPKLDIMHPSKPTTKAEGFIQAAGSTIGMIVPFVLTRGAVRGALGSKLSTSLASAAVENGATGFIVGSVLTPSEKGKNFWESRLATGLTDGATFATLGVTAKSLGGTKALASTSESLLLSRVSKATGVGVLSGLPAGLVNAEFDSITHGRGLAKLDEVAGRMKDFALFGGLLGGASAVKVRPFALAEQLKPAQVVKPIEPLAPVEMIKTVEVAKPVPVAKAEPAALEVKTESKATRTQREKEIAVNKKNYLGEGDEGKVYSNGDGTVTKVYFDQATNVEAVKAIYTRLESIGIRLPKILEVGKGPEGRPAIKMEQIGDGDHLQYQLISGQLSAADMTALRQQYYAFGDAITKAGIRIDWQLKNMRFENGKLYILDPSFLKEQPLAPSTVDRYGSAIGPRPK